MKLLYLLRHAKSSWEDPALEDLDRPLSPRGKRASQLIAEHLHRSGVAPALVLCSSSLRTRETLAAIVPVLEGDAEVRIEGALYAAGVDELLARLQAVPESAPSVMLIAHNPGLQQLALSLARSGRALERLRERFPTAALATLAISAGGWAELGQGDAQLEAYVVPRELQQNI